jgi:tetratricopeptide (TPR) repeat protein
MVRARFIVALLFTTCLSLATYLEPRLAHMEQNQGRSANVLALLLGDGRKMFANQIFAKADAYFHRGNYPSIFDLNARKEEDHMTGETEDHEDHEDHAEEGQEKEEGPPPRDCIEAFGRHFYPSVHVHLEKGAEREMLPWLKFCAEMDPHRVETYTVAAYWLRERLGKVDEAEQFLHDGLRANPNDPNILNELARLYLQNRQDLRRARNVWVVALRRWQEVEGVKEKPDELLHEQILGGLSQVERKDGRLPEAIGYLQQLKKVSPNPEAVQRQIDELVAQVRRQGQN